MNELLQRANEALGTVDGITLVAQIRFNGPNTKGTVDTSLLVSSKVPCVHVSGSTCLFFTIAVLR